jgi:hypothetical protein
MNVGEVTSDCSMVQVKDSNGKTILKIKLHGECEIDIEMDANGFEMDTTINICN